MFSSELKESNKNSSAGSCGCSNRLEDFPDGYFSRDSSTFSAVVSVLVTCFDVGFGKSECLMSCGLKRVLNMNLAIIKLEQALLARTFKISFFKHVVI